MKDSRKKEENKRAEEKNEKTVVITEQEYKRLQEEAAKAGEYWDRILRIQAEFDNTRKRIERERQDYVKFANEGIILGLLNIMDDLERAVGLAQGKHEDFSAFLKGAEMILAHLYELMKEHGLSVIEAKGKPFDPNYHEALMQIDSDLSENTVVEELQKGYLLNDRVIRTSKVKVSRKTKIEEKNKED